MADAIERIVNLALYLASATGPVSLDALRRDVIGYPTDQDESAFLRMFERDKDELRGAGFVILADEAGRYQLDADATFASDISLTPQETALVRAAGSAALSDPSFPFKTELRLALAKLSASIDPVEIPVSAHQADESPEDQAEAAAALDLAARAAKTVHFGYTNSLSVSAAHHVEPYGLFLRDGRWYLVGRDTGRGDVRVYAVARMREIEVNAARPKSPDFVRPKDFDVSRFIRLPFQYGGPELVVVLDFDERSRWRAQGLTGGQGVLEPDGTHTLWTVTVRDSNALMRWVIENGPGISLRSPAALVDTFAEQMGEVAELHD